MAPLPDLRAELEAIYLRWSVFHDDHIGMDPVPIKCPCGILRGSYHL